MIPPPLLSPHEPGLSHIQHCSECPSSFSLIQAANSGSASIQSPAWVSASPSRSSLRSAAWTRPADGAFSPGSNAQCAAKRLTEWLFGAVSQRLRDCTLDGGQRKPGPGVAEFDGKAIPDLLESGADGETRVEKRRLDQNPEEVRITMQPFEGGKHFVPPQRPLRHLLEDIEDMIDEWFAEGGGGSPIGVAK